MDESMKKNTSSAQSLSNSEQNSFGLQPPEFKPRAAGSSIDQNDVRSIKSKSGYSSGFNDSGNMANTNTSEKEDASSGKNDIRTIKSRTGQNQSFNSISSFLELSDMSSLFGKREEKEE